MAEEHELSSPVHHLDHGADPVVVSNIYKPALCDRCAKAMEAWTEAGEIMSGYRYNDTTIFMSVIDLATIVHPPCFLCRRLFRNAFEWQGEMRRLTDGLRVEVEYSRRISNGEHFILVYFQGDRTPICNLKVISSAEDLALYNSDSLGPTTVSDEAINAALTWMESCENSHGQCHKPLTFLPTRLLDVGSGSEPKVRLVLGKDLPRRSRYLTLSHCWGGHMPNRLSTINLATFGKEINIDTLSKTFQDAIHVTRRLHHQYVWIDSLCIIQDNLSDWHSESSQMGDIYANSSCNISASASRDGSQGLFRSRNSSMNELERIPLKLFRWKHRRLYPLWDTSTWFDNIERSPLNLRAWVCQERFLSTCNLHFGIDQLFWECKEFSACEMFPKGFPRSIREADPADIKKDISKGTENPRDGVMRNSLWDTLLGNYTASKVTFAQDKLVAFAGLAAMWAKASNDEYLAGLWRSRLPKDLLWYTPYPRIDNERLMYVAPSWSWASIDGEATWLHEKYERPYPLAEIMKVDVELASSNPFGQVKSASMILTGQLARGQWHSFGDNVYIQVSSELENIVNMKVYWDKPKNVQLNDPCFREAFLYFLPIIRENTTEGATTVGGSVKTFQGLVLQRVRTESLTFKRLGMFRVLGAIPCSIVEKACIYFSQFPDFAKVDNKTYLRGEKAYNVTLL